MANRSLTATGPVRRMFVTAIALVAVPAAALAQATIAPLTATAARADALHQRAAGLFEAPTRYREASRLLRQAAALRDGLDDRVAAELLLAGRLSYYAGDWRTAQRAFEDAGERALESGQLIVAASAWVDAAFTAQARKNEDDASGFVLRARRLADSPHLTRAERDEILDRIGPVSVALTNAGR